MRPAYDDRPDARVPADRPLTADDLRRVRFSLAFRGYRMSEVDALLARLAREQDEHGLPPTDAPAPPGPAEHPGTHAAKHRRFPRVPPPSSDAH